MKTSLFALFLILSAPAFAAPSPVPPAASAASSSVPTLGGKDRPVASPVVRAAERAQEPGKLRPESAVVPQIVLPLRRDKDSQAGPDAPKQAGGVDDRAARCVARTTKSARAECAADAVPAKKP